MKKTSRWNTVTPLSKYLAMALFIALPFAGIILGMRYQRAINVIDNKPKQFLTVDPASGLHLYQTDDISFAVDPNIFGVDYRITDGLAVKSNPSKTTFITISNPVGDSHLQITLNLDGIGGGCPNFPDGYELSPINLDGHMVYKAKYIGKSSNNKDWPTGNIYLVDKWQQNGESHWNCPNVAGIKSTKNGFTTIKYDMSKLPLDSAEYKQTEKAFDEVITSIKNFWQ